MFVSQPEYELPFPPGLAAPGTHHWRMVELTLHAPWFLLSLEIVDPETPDCRMTRTLCIAWDNDLVGALRSVESSRVTGIVCMMPAWQSATGQWASREIQEVWELQSAAGRSLMLTDATGETFDCGLVLDHQGPIERELVWSGAPTRKPSGLSRNRAARRGRGRQAAA